MTTYTPNFGLALPDFRQGPWHDQINSDLTKIDALLYSALSGANVALWANSTLYGEGETVLDDTDASIWLCAVEHTSAISPITFATDRANHPTYWTRLLTGFAPRGQWANATNYFPYDLVYDSSLGIMALCNQKHISNTGGDIKDDAIYWEFLIDMSNADLSTAVAVSYSNAASPTLPATNVQDAIDILENQVVSLNTVNVSQGTQISNLQTKDGVHETRMTAIEQKNTDQTAADAALQGQITALQNQVNAIPVTTFPTGTVMLFLQAAPPTGWIINGSFHDRALRIVNDASGGTNGGSIAFSTVFSRVSTDGAVLSAAQMPSHDHGNIPSASTFTSGGYVNAPGLNYVGQPPHPGRTDAQGGNQAHAHNIEMRVAYTNVVAGQKT